MRTILRSIVAALVVAPLAACNDPSELLSPDVAAPTYYRGEPAGSGAVTSPHIALLDFTIHGSDLEEPTRYQIPLAAGASAMGLDLPTGAGYELEIRGYDRYGEQTHEARSGLGPVEFGENPALEVELRPVGEGEAVAAGIAVTGREPAPKGLRVVLEPDLGEIAQGGSTGLRAYGIDPDGNRIELEPRELNWIVDDPHDGWFDFGPKLDLNALPTFQAGSLQPGRLIEIIVAFRGNLGGAKLSVFRNGFVDVSAGRHVTCGVRELGDAYCWGSNADLMLGTGNAVPRDLCIGESSSAPCELVPVPVATTLGFSSVSVGAGHVCALERTTSTAFCWGSNSAGQLGIGTLGLMQSSSPIAVAAPAGSGTMLAFRSISAGTRVTCAVTADDEEFCWGAGFGAAPVSVGRTVLATTAADGFTCRMRSTGVECDAAPPGDQPFPWSFMGQATTASHVCAISAGATWCWGDSSNGKLGNGQVLAGRTEVTGVTLASVATGATHSCGLERTVAFCWGRNYNGELGIDSYHRGTPTPQPVTKGGGTPEWTKVTAGAAHTCAIDVDFDVWCWGNNYMGQLGLGSKLDFDTQDPRKGVFAPWRPV